ncbi:MAG: hypothetical protein D6734_09335, partial [Candidatus Schekmanbacteria bacterium]
MKILKDKPNITALIIAILFVFSAFFLSMRIFKNNKMTVLKQFDIAQRSKVSFAIDSLRNAYEHLIQTIDFIKHETSENRRMGQYDIERISMLINETLTNT